MLFHVRYDGNAITERELLAGIRRTGEAQGETYRPAVVVDAGKT